MPSTCRSCCASCWSPEQAPALLLNSGGAAGQLDLLPAGQETPLPVLSRCGRSQWKRLAEFAVRLDQMPVGSSGSNRFSCGGWLVYLATNSPRFRNPTCARAVNWTNRWPCCCWPVSAAVVRDRQTGQTTLTGRDLDWWRDRQAGAGGRLPRRRLKASSDLVLELQEDDPPVFFDGVARIHEALQAGDVFQVLSRAWRPVAADVDLNALFVRLCAPPIRAPFRRGAATR